MHAYALHSGATCPVLPCPYFRYGHDERHSSRRDEGHGASGSGRRDERSSKGEVARPERDGRGEGGRPDRDGGREADHHHDRPPRPPHHHHEPRGEHARSAGPGRPEGGRRGGRGRDRDREGEERGGKEVWGKPEEEEPPPAPAAPVAKPNMELSGKLAAETNKVGGGSWRAWRLPLLLGCRVDPCCCPQIVSCGAVGDSSMLEDFTTEPH